MKYIYVLVLVIFGSISCSVPDKPDSPNLIEIKHSVNEKIPVIMDSVLSEFSILYLRTPDTIFIGSINKIVFSRNRIFISDNRTLNTVFIFDSYGQYVNRIEGGYKGPGEFIRPMSISTNYDQDELFVYDDKLQKIITYDSEGEYVVEIKYKYPSTDLSHIGNGTFALNSGYPQIDNKFNSYDLLYISDNGKVMDKFLPLKSWRKGSIFNKENTFSEYLDTTWYCPVYNDTIYYLSDKGPVPKFHLNMGAKFINDEIAKKINLDDPYSEYQHAIVDFHKAGQVIYFSYNITEKKTGRNIIQHIFYNLKSKNSKSGEFLSGPGISSGLFRSPVSSTGEYFVASVDAFDLKRTLESFLNTGREIPEERMELFLSINESDNPCLLFYKVAPF